MHKSLIVAQSEFATLVRSRAFIISVILMPVVMVGSVLIVRATKDATDSKDRTFAFVDHSGVLGPQLKAAAEDWNKVTSAAGGGPRTAPRFLPVEVRPDGRDAGAVRLELCDRIRRGEFFAFVEIPANILDPDARAGISYFSDHPAYVPLPEWLRTTANRLIVNERFRNADIDRAMVTRLTRPAPVDKLGLIARDEQGNIKEAEPVDDVRALAVPAVFMFLMYVTVMSGAPQLLNSVIEEKMSRISEVLIGSVTPFELMTGKLIGSVSVSILLAIIYIAGGLAVARYFGYPDVIPPPLFAWFLLFLVMAVLIFGSMFIAIGAACTDLKDSQSMMTPVMLLVMLPMLTWASVLRAPDGMMATGLSLFPTAAPFLMMLRISLRPGPPLWQVILSLALMMVTTIAVVWAAGKIFRTGLLMQGKSASVTEMMRWVRAR